MTFVPGSPVGNEMKPMIMAALGVGLAGQVAERGLRAWNRLRAGWENR